MGKKKKIPHGMRSRRDWGELNPVERIVKDKKKYNRKRQKRRDRMEYAEDDKEAKEAKLAYEFDEEIRIASVKKIKLFGSATMDNCSGWYIPYEDVLLYFSNMGHKAFVQKYFSKKPKSIDNKVADKIIKDTREKLDVDRNPVGYHSFLGLGWIRIFNPSTFSIFMESAKQNIRDIVDVLDVFSDKVLDKGTELSISGKRVLFDAGEFPSMKDISVGLRSASIVDRVVECVLKKRIGSIINSVYVKERFAKKQDLDSILESFDIPQSRRDTDNPSNLRWLGRNIGARNSDNPQFELAIKLLKEKLRKS